MKYTKKPITIDALRLGFANISDLKKWVESFGQSFEENFIFTDQGAEGASLRVKTLEGTSYNTKPGEWIIRGVNGEYYPCQDDVFRKSYDESPSPQAGSEMYRWVKASERLPEVNQQVFTRVLDSNDQIYESSLRYRGNGRWERQYPKDNFSIPMERVEWLEPIPDSNQEELWNEICEIIIDAYNHMDTQEDMTKELSSKYIIVKR